MAIAKVVLVEDEKNPSKEFRAQLKKEGFDVTACVGGFDALDELGSQGADIVVASTSLTDLSGYQLSCLIKSNDRTSKLPVMLLAKGDASDQDTFWKVAALPDAVVDSDTLNQDLKSVCTQIKGLVSKAQDTGWQPNMVKNLLVPSRSFSSENVINSYAGLLDDLLIERLVSRVTRTMAEVIDPRKKFVDAYFSLISQLFEPDLLGLVVASADGPWAAFQLKPDVSQPAYEQLIEKLTKDLEIVGELNLDMRGELPKDEGGKSLEDIEILPISADKSGKAALVFASTEKNSFNATSKAFMGQLQLQMAPVVQLLVAKHEIEVLHEREAFRAAIDPLTGLYNLEFLVGFLQQQLLFSFRQRLAVGMAIIDIDNFAKINDEFGYEIGDVVLTTIANRLLNITRSSDLIARYGGDEFAVVLPNTDIAGAKILGEKVRSEVERISFVKGQGTRGPKVTVSVGCSFFNMEDLNPETILRDAKLALQQAKEGGRN
ncbi:MAG: diguanylate cyclase, partial [Candidatus Melainabacteria bacterium]|nr:diguanylate cyclase [Candidatus Melainabacteria bacterium]